MDRFIISFSITELSNLTGKTRPTIYKYVNSFLRKDFDSIPYSFIKLFEMMQNPNSIRANIIDYCHLQFDEIDTNDSQCNNIITLIKANKEKINLQKLKQYIEEELKNEKCN